MRIFRKQATRAPLTTVLLVLLLALSIAASSIGFAAWTGARQQLTRIDEQYTTIAVPSGANLEKKFEAGDHTIGAGRITFSDGTSYISAHNAEATARRSEYYVETDNRILLSAHVEGGTALSSGTLDPLQYNFTLDQYCYQLSVMALRCVSIEETFYEGAYYRTYGAWFEIVDDVCRIDAYDLPPYEDTLVIESSIFTSDGEIPFEVGKTYLIRGRYWDYDIRVSFGAEPMVRGTDGIFKIRSMLMDPEYPLMETPQFGTGMARGLPNWTLEKKQYSDSGQYYWCTPEENCWPYYAEYTGDWRDFLETEEGLVWKDEIIPYVEMNHASVPVILTDDISSMYYFNTGDASILEGASFSDSDYQEGNNVCIVSASYAKVNNLSVGDTIHLDYYQTGYEQQSYPVLQGSGRIGMTVLRYPLTENKRIGVEKDYTILGIYTAPEWQAGVHSFHADTVFVPKASVPNADNYAGDLMDMLNTVIIENGSIDAFEAYMAANDKGGVYIYFDQGYTEAAATVQTMIDNASRLMGVGAAMFALASLLFLLLFARKVSAVMRSMRLLGIPKKGVWLECLQNLLIQILFAVLLGNGIAVLLYQQITGQILSTTPELSTGSVILCAAAQFGILFLLGGIWMHSIAGQNLMQREKGTLPIQKQRPKYSGA